MLQDFEKHKHLTVQVQNYLGFRNIHFECCITESKYLKLREANAGIEFPQICPFDSDDMAYPFSPCSARP